MVVSIINDSENTASLSRDGMESSPGALRDSYTVVKETDKCNYCCGLVTKGFESAFLKTGIRST